MKLEIQTLKQYLDSLDVASEVLPRTEEAYVEQLDIPLGVDEQDRPRRIIVMIERDDEGFEDEEEEDEVHLVKMLGILPIEVKEEHLGDTARMVSFINHVADIPGFILSEPLASVHFLYGLACPKGEIEPEQFVATLGLVGTMMDLYQDQLESVAVGNTRFDDILSAQPDLEEFDEEPDDEGEE